jgi:hypothetical protein
MSIRIWTRRRKATAHEQPSVLVGCCLNSRPSGSSYQCGLTVHTVIEPGSLAQPSQAPQQLQDTSDRTGTASHMSMRPFSSVHTTVKSCPTAARERTFSVLEILLYCSTTDLTDPTQWLGVGPLLSSDDSTLTTAPGRFCKSASSAA